MEIRLATLTDLNACLAIDDSFETEYVWQMQERTSTGSISIGFHLTHLPRPMKVSGVISREDVALNFQQGGTLFVADDGAVRGFVDVTTAAWNQAAWVNNLVVAPPFRRRGVGSRLLRAALDWARQNKSRIAFLDTSTKDYPAICFYQKHGFSFCGFNDQLYPNRDIALFLALNLR